MWLGNHALHLGKVFCLECGRRCLLLQLRRACIYSQGWQSTVVLTSRGVFPGMRNEIAQQIARLTLYLIGFPLHLQSSVLEWWISAANLLNSPEKKSKFYFGAKKNNKKKQICSEGPLLKFQRYVPEESLTNFCYLQKGCCYWPDMH